jgi:hypothetical protein
VVGPYLHSPIRLDGAVPKDHLFSLVGGRFILTVNTGTLTAVAKWPANFEFVGAFQCEG